MFLPNACYINIKLSPENVKEKNEKKKDAFKSRFNESRILLMDLKWLWKRRKKDEYFTSPPFFFTTPLSKIPPKTKRFNFFHYFTIKATFHYFLRKQEKMCLFKRNGLNIFVLVFFIYFFYLASL